MEDIVIQITGGEVTLKKPTAGAFADAMEEAEISDGKLKMTKMFNQLLPYCIKTHPWGTVPIKQALRGLDPEDYVKLFNRLKDVINIQADAAGK